MQTIQAYREIKAAVKDLAGTPLPVWQELALCRETDPDAFFPENGASPRPAKRICGLCEVAVSCLDYALSNNEQYGVWGGLDAPERRQLKRRAA
jgi:WhiB family redox-sensing transcriptional regulator